MIHQPIPNHHNVNGVMMVLVVELVMIALQLVLQLMLQLTSQLPLNRYFSIR
jgi:hypothetical protein